MSEAFARNKVDSPRLSAEILLTHVIGVGSDRLKLYTDPDRPATPEELGKLRAMVARALKQEPIQYLTSEAYFFGLRLMVDSRVLIPRPSTETLVEELLQEFRRRQQLTPGEASAPVIADVCTGSGCIAIAILKNLPKAMAIATDISEGALQVALANATTHKVHERLELLQGDLLAPLGERIPSAACEGLDALVSNPPYIPDHEWPDVPPNVKDHEPHLALRGGPEGVNAVGPLINAAPALLKPGGILAIEIAACTAAAVLQLAQAHPRLTGAKILRDSDQLERVLWARRAE